MNALEVLSTIGAVITVLLLIGGTFALFTGSYRKARIQGLREDNDDLRNRISDLESKSQSQDVEIASLKTDLGHRMQENQLLMAMVTQRAEVGEVMVAMTGLITTVEELQTKAEAHWLKMLAALEALNDDKSK